MAPGYDPANPGDSSQISAYPTNERAQRTATEVLQQIEHNDDSGKHTFPIGDDDARQNYFDTPSQETEHFQLWGNDSTQDFNTTLEIQYRLPGSNSWVGLRTELLERQNAWSKAQAGSWVNQNAAGIPNLTMDFSVTNYFDITINQDITILNPTLPTRPTGRPGANFFLEIIQATAGDHQILSFGDEFVFPTGVPPLNLTPGIGAHDILQMLIRADKKIHVEVLRDSKGLV